MAFNTNQKGILSEINVTPFVDVMLVLLIIFMATAPMMIKGVDVDLPKTKAVQTLPEDTENIVVSIKANGTVFINEHEAQAEFFEQQLQQMVQKKTDIVYLKADTNVPYGKVVEIMGKIKQSGIEKLGVIAEEPQKVL